jgi:hypothetical protein
MKFAVYIDINYNIKDDNESEALLKSYRCKYNVKKYRLEENIFEGPIQEIKKINLQNILN